jgi:hypothetical protein
VKENGKEDSERFKNVKYKLKSINNKYLGLNTPKTFQLIFEGFEFLLFPLKTIDSRDKQHRHV